MPNFAKYFSKSFLAVGEAVADHCIDCGDAQRIHALLLVETRLSLQEGHVALRLDLG